MVTSTRTGSAAYKMVTATLVITTPLPSLENSSKRDGAQLKKTVFAGTFVVVVPGLSTAEYALVPDFAPSWRNPCGDRSSGRASRPRWRRNPCEDRSSE